ncbi:MAG TPA: hypothetical protein VM219_07035 [Phycisphaerae bacterium]|nr:hypothetical protein [Phycisphaerae bacterium]
MRFKRRNGQVGVGLVVLAVCAAMAALAGCGPAYKPLPYVPKPATAPEILCCHDGVGHVKGNEPWILGGTCCCTPTRENYNLHISQGTIPRSMSYEEYLALYKKRGIVTDLDHKGCGNLCSHGLHVILGGKCMATPTPSAWMYECVTYGPHTPIMGAEAGAEGE